MYICPVCSVKKKEFRFLKCHLVSHFLTQLKKDVCSPGFPFTCFDCKKKPSFRDTSSLILHQAFKHKILAKYVEINHLNLKAEKATLNEVKKDDHEAFNEDKEEGHEEVKKKVVEEEAMRAINLGYWTGTKSSYEKAFGKSQIVQFPFKFKTH